MMVLIITPYFPGKVTNSKKLKAVTGDINIDGMKPYSFKALMPVVVVGNKFEYQPSLEILANSKRMYNFEGVLSHKGGRQMQAELTATGVTESPLSAQGMWTRVSMFYLMVWVSIFG